MATTDVARCDVVVPTSYLTLVEPPKLSNYSLQRGASHQVSQGLIPRLLEFYIVDLTISELDYILQKLWSSIDPWGTAIALFSKHFLGARSSLA